jgi:hypothetical protein
VVSPSHTSPAANDVKDCLQFAMMVGTSFGVRLDYYRSGPELVRRCSGMGDCGGPGHTRSLGRIGIQVAA